MNKLIKAVIAGLIPILLILLLPVNAGAAGFAVGPAKIEISDALAGEEYQETIFLKYTNEGSCGIELSATGDISDWVRFYDLNDSTTPIERITAAAGEWTYVVVKFSIPDDALTGTATGTIYAQTVAPEGESGQVLSLQGKVDVTITVTGTGILTGVVKSISTTDVEAGYPLRIKVHFQNTADVAATPQVGVEIIRDDSAIDSFTFAETKVKPENSETISVEWDTTGSESGNYVANVSVSLRHDVIAAKELPFAILPEGTLTRAGAFTELALQGEPKVGTIAKIQATFFNTGQIDTKAKFIGEAYCDKELVDTLESEETLIPVGQQEMLTSYVKLERPGNYDIKGYINYEGKKTEVKEISFAIGKAGGGLPFSLSTPFIIGVIVVLIAVIAFLALRRRRRAA